MEQSAPEQVYMNSRDRRRLRFQILNQEKDRQRGINSALAISGFLVASIFLPSGILSFFGFWVACSAISGFFVFNIALKKMSEKFTLVQLVVFSLIIGMPISSIVRHFL